MPLSAYLERKLARKYDPATVIDFRYRGKDITIRTDSEGNPVVLFIGKRERDGRIRGQRYARTLEADSNGRVIRDHWDMKGKRELKTDFIRYRYFR